jgi:hypothetical protein
MYNKDGTRLQNKGFNLIVCLIFWTLKWYMYDTLTSPFTVSQISSRRYVNSWLTKGLNPQSAALEQSTLAITDVVKHGILML